MDKKQIHVLVSTHQGVLYDEYCDYVLVSSKKGEFGILPDHISIIKTIDEGYLKLERDQDVYFIALVNGAVMFNNNKLSVVTQEAFIGNSKERAKELLLEIRKERLEQNRRIDAQLEITERELKENIKEAKAGSI